MSHTIESPSIKEPIPPTFGDGIEFEFIMFEGRPFEERHGPAVTARCASNFTDEGLRKVTMEVSSWVGISIGANHHYVRLKFWGGTINNPDGTRHAKAGSSPSNRPKESESVEVEVRRPVTQRDIDYAKKRKDGWIPRKTDTERGFWSEQEAHDAGLACFKEHFAPGWVLLGHDPKTGNEIELARS